MIVEHGQEPIILFEKQQQTNKTGQSTFVNMSNGELIELADGTILIACNYPSSGWRHCSFCNCHKAQCR